MMGATIILGSLLIIAVCALGSAYRSEKEEVRSCHQEIERLNKALHVAIWEWEKHLTLSDYRIVINEQEFPVYKAMGVVRPTKAERITKATLIKLTEGPGTEHVEDIEFPFELTALSGDIFKLPLKL